VTEPVPEAAAAPTGETAPAASPRIYVASLSDYNAGVLHGTWLDASEDVEAMQSEIDGMLATSPTTRRHGDVAEEWAIHDHEGWGGIQLSEYESLEIIGRLAEGSAAHGPAFAAWVSLVGTEQGSSVEDFEDHYHGQFDSLEGYGESMLDEMGVKLDELPGVPEGLWPYVSLDAAGWVRDMQCGGEIAAVEGEGGVYVFWGI